MLVHFHHSLNSNRSNHPPTASLSFLFSSLSPHVPVKTNSAAHTHLMIQIYFHHFSINSVASQTRKLRPQASNGSIATSTTSARSPIPSISKLGSSRLAQTPTKTNTLKRPKSTHNMSQPELEIPPQLPVRSTTSMTNRTVSDTSPKTPSKSSQALRELLTNARKKAKKLDQSPHPSASKVASIDEVSTDWGFQPLEKSIEKAQRTGSYMSHWLSEFVNLWNLIFLQSLAFPQVD